METSEVLKVHFRNRDKNDGTHCGEYTSKWSAFFSVPQNLPALVTVESYREGIQGY